MRWLDCASVNQQFNHGSCKMTENYIIETPHGAAGLVIRDRRGFRFFSANHEFDALEGKAFANPQSAAAAAIQQAQRISRAARLSSASSRGSNASDARCNLQPFRSKVIDVPD